MEQDKKYYTPLLKDLYIGYQLEMRSQVEGTFEAPEDKWVPITVKDIDSYDIEVLAEGKDIRSKYLDKQDIEECGWVLEGRVTDITTRYERGEMMMAYNTENHTMAIWVKDETPYDTNSLTNSPPSYKGLCKSINELRKIVEWIEITNE